MITTKIHSQGCKIFERSPNRFVRKNLNLHGEITEKVIAQIVLSRKSKVYNKLFSVGKTPNSFVQGNIHIHLENMHHKMWKFSNVSDF